MKMSFYKRYLDRQLSDPDFKKYWDKLCVYKTFKHGDYTIKNVPHQLYEGGFGADGKEHYIDGSVMYRLTFILKSMQENGEFIADYTEE